MWVTVFQGKRKHNRIRISSTYSNQIEVRVIVFLANNKITGLGPVGTEMKKLFLFHSRLGYDYTLLRGGLCHKDDFSP
jgi:hypothetical protein